MEQIVLPNVTLAAIIRDEMMNPAGGIVDFIDSTMPFVEEAVIVDTGSIDGTREVLEELQGKYENLKVFDAEFRGYAQARNESLKYIENDRKVLVLDADERLTKDDFRHLTGIIHQQEEILKEKCLVYIFDFLHILPDGNAITRHVQPYRLCNLYHSEFREKIYPFFRGDCYERLEFTVYDGGHRVQLQIKHFLPNEIALREKEKQLYDPLISRLFPYKFKSDIRPSSIPSFPEWKAYNPQRENYR